MRALHRQRQFGLLIAIVIFCVMLTLQGCSSVPTSTFNDQAAITMRSVTTARDTSTALLQAGKITLEQDALNQQRLDAIVEGVKNARALQPRDPVAAEGALVSLKVEAERVAK